MWKNTYCEHCAYFNESDKAPCYGACRKTGYGEIEPFSQDSPACPDFVDVALNYVCSECFVEDRYARYHEDVAERRGWKIVDGLPKCPYCNGKQC